ncbi:hypothetical protein AC579_5273 [Pseudocercospora musae]|uniref:Uncharacterized protein n=1 Tax=Pseudocercospora musae TaxID=113226 RepID=A0A139IQB3_9PEZI|nr:hypothetical protein AC579_5273 [Pseudocercospora musae]
MQIVNKTFPQSSAARQAQYRRTTSILRLKMSKPRKIKKTRRARHTMHAQPAPTATARVFNTSELAEMVFIHLPLKALCLAMRIEKTPHQVSNNPSSKAMRESRYIATVPNNTDTFLRQNAEEVFAPTNNGWITVDPFLDPCSDHMGLLRIKALAEAFVPESVQEQLIVRTLRPVTFFYSYDPSDWRSGYGVAEMIIHDSNGGKIKKLVEHAEMRGDKADDVVVLYFHLQWLAIDGDVRTKEDTEDWLTEAEYI